MSMRSVGAVQLHTLPASMPEKIGVFISENTMVLHRLHGDFVEKTPSDML